MIGKVNRMIRFYNTLAGKIEEFKPHVDGEVRLYTCGPTVYDYAHIGNFRAYMFEDLLKRFLQYNGFKVTHVMNITDVDDKTMSGARQAGVSLQDYTKKYIEAFFEDLDTLKISRADFYPRATQFIPEMAAMVKGLVEKGFAYEKEGNYYFEIAKFKDYGKLAKIDPSELKAGARVEADTYEKESVHDFALWKARKPGEVYWETEIGPGRPGWHIECSVMSSKYLGESFDIHCGGVDNIFPHHENEIAQSEAYTGKKFVNYWLHCQHLIRDGEKMSKSLGNTITISELIEGHGADPLALRYLLLGTHYRRMLNFTFAALDQATAALQRIRDFWQILQESSFPEAESEEIGSAVEKAEEEFAGALGDDLNISAALSSLFSLIKAGNILIDREKMTAGGARELLGCLQRFDTVLAILPLEGATILSDEIEEKIKTREQARKDKDYDLADKIRDELFQKGVILEDTKDGVRWKLKSR